MAGSNFGNQVVGWMLQSPLHGMLDSSTMLVSVTGRRSGKPVVTPVNFTREDDHLWVTSLRSRQWWRNCRACAQMKVLLKGQWVNATAEVIGDRIEVVNALTHLFEFAPRLARVYGVRMEKTSLLNGEKLSALADRSVVIRIQLS